MLSAAASTWFVALCLAAASDIRSDEVVVFHPSYAYFDVDAGAWRVQLQGVVFEPEEGALVRAAAVASLRRMLDIESDTAEARRFDARVRLFLVDHERGKTVQVQLPGHTAALGPSDKQGRLLGALELSAGDGETLLNAAQAASGWVEYRAVLAANDGRPFTGQVQFVPPVGVSIISDIDDTIKVSEVGSVRRMLRNTFLREFEAVPGMADLYAAAAERDAAFHYVSRSPWQLYSLLAEMLAKERFPAGSFHLRHFELADIGRGSQAPPPGESKGESIRRIMDHFPQRRFILIGDAVQEDPEVYGAIARERPRQVAGVFIRRAPGANLDQQRIATAFQGLDTETWALFDEPAEIRETLLRIVGPSGR